MKNEIKGAREKREFVLSVISLLLMAALVAMAQFDLLPIVGKYEKQVLNLCAIYTILGLSMNLVNGFTGLFSLGQAGFMAIGAYTTSLLIMAPETKDRVFYLEPIHPFVGALQAPFWVALLLSGLLAAVVAFFIGFPVLRLRGDYLAIATLGFAEIIRIIFLNTQTVTNGSMGIKAIPPTANLFWCFGAAALMVLFMLRLIHSTYGRAFKAIRDDEIAAEAMGINLFRHKMYAFILSAFMAGVGGGLMASVVSAITPNLFRFTLAYDILLIVVLGGMGSITGTVVAAFVITIAKEWLRWLDAGFTAGPLKVPEIPGLRMVVFSVLLMCIILFYRQGFFGSKEFSWKGLAALPKNLGIKIRRLFSRDKKEAA
ncbi:MAG: branched-chain amino acid ABC transporter permease [Clostridia bacterium]|nr:branched-chain amino acid ABC transporter permease [Clostridia bacterium]